MKLYFGKLDSNHHGTQKKGESWNKQTIHGPCFDLVKLEGFDKDSRLRTIPGFRIIFYFPSGAWWYLDFYK